MVSILGVLHCYKKHPSTVLMIESEGVTGPRMRLFLSPTIPFSLTQHRSLGTGTMQNASTLDPRLIGIVLTLSPSIERLYQSASFYIQSLKAHPLKYVCFLHYCRIGISRSELS